MEESTSNFQQGLWHTMPKPGKLLIMRIVFAPPGWVTFERQETEEDNVCMYHVIERRITLIKSLLEASGFIEQSGAYIRVS